MVVKHCPDCDKTVSIFSYYCLTDFAHPEGVFTERCLQKWQKSRAQDIGRRRLGFILVS